MNIRTIAATPLTIPFIVSFRHASADRSETSTVWAKVELTSGMSGFGESCPREYVTAESIATAQTFAARHEASLRERVGDVDSLRAWMADHRGEIDANPAAWCALELGILDAFAKDDGRTVEAFLSLPEIEGRFRYTAVLGDAPPNVFKATVDQYVRFGFADFKVKLSGDTDRDREKTAVLRTLGSDSIRVRVDANNLWVGADEAIRHLRALEYPFFGVEEPLPPNRYDELARVADALNCPIVLDESALRADQLGALPGPSTRWIVNVRVSKMGGLLRSLDVVRAARARSIGVIVGAQVGETSLLTRVALTVATGAGPALIAQEGAFGTRLLSRDVCDPPLMFGPGGLLDAAAFPALQQPGFGVV
jgi:L-alanine-DL-glutamate epimerase-like enolase superfamily enzyme